MQKKSLLFLLLILAIACNSGGDGGGSDDTSTPDEITSPVDGNDDGADTGSDPGDETPGDTQPDDPSDDQNNSSVPTQALTFDANIYYVNFSKTQEAKYEKAVEIVKKVVATEEFRSKVLNHTYNGKKTYVDNGGKSNSQIYQMILDGAETLQPTKNNRMDLEVELYYAATSTVGYTYANSKRIWVNTKYFNSYTPASVAGNLFHEWLHKVGFGHAVSYSTSRDYSVPYAIGRMISTLGKKYE